MLDIILLASPERKILAGVIKETAYYSLKALCFDWDSSSIIVILQGQNGIVRTENFTGLGASTALTTFKKGDFRTSNIQKQVLQKLLTDGRLQGTLSTI